MRGAKRRAQLAHLIQAFTEERGYPPSIRDLCALTGLSSTSTIKSHLDALVAEGRLVVGSPQRRSLTILDEEQAS